MSIGYVAQIEKARKEKPVVKEEKKIEKKDENVD
jgi:hypothetical protein